MDITIHQDSLNQILIVSGIIFGLLFYKVLSLRKSVQQMASKHKNDLARASELRNEDIQRLENKAVQLRKEHQLLAEDLTEKLSIKSERVTYLEDKYKALIDADAAAEIVTTNALNEANELLSDAEEYKCHQQRFSDELVQKADEQLKQARQTRKEARGLFEHAQIAATQRSEKIIETARQEARLIAAEAYDIKGKEKELSQAIEAMKNVISGYKDDYIVPNITVLDDLAEEYAFSNPGKKLKELRAEVRRIVKNNLAGTCDYVEEQRKNNAIHFVVDAFNGKIESSLAKVKHDNYGKLAQEIKDAFALVNHNGRSFRNARITDTFLQVRLEELKWAVATHEIRQQELLEQREYRERIREESKARREYEAAIKRAEHEETLIENAIKEATEKLALASAEERAIYESNIMDLQEKLRAAEISSQRALSMAQQTKRGHVYVISNIGSFGERIYKIGMTRRLEPKDRVKELGDASVPFEFDIHAMIYSDNAPALEAHLHRAFHENRVNKINARKEFFYTSISEIKEVIENTDIGEVSWSLKAQAREFYESQQLSNKSAAIA